MLVLSRKEGERIVIGSSIEVVIVEVSKGRVRIGITAPTEVPIYREEVARRLALEAFADTAQDSSVSEPPCTATDAIEICLPILHSN